MACIGVAPSVTSHQQPIGNLMQRLGGAAEGGERVARALVQYADALACDADADDRGVGRTPLTPIGTDGLTECGDVAGLIEYIVLNLKRESDRLRVGRERRVR